MKSALMIVVVFALLLAACQTATPPVTEAPVPVETQISTPIPAEATSTPASEEPYPGAEEPAGGNPDEAYPGPEQGSTPVQWEEAAELILDDKVAQVTQYDNLIVILVLKDGQILSTREPAIDEIINLIKECGDSCKDIEIPTN